jgi:protein involved in polysaccharide export with SLBB domain
MRSNWFRAVVSVVLAVVMMLPATVPALAQTGAGPGGTQWAPFPGGQFGAPGFGNDFGMMPMPYAQPQPYYAPALPAPGPAADSSSRPQMAAPGICTSQTYQTLTYPGQTSQVRTVAARSAAQPAARDRERESDDRKTADVVRTDLDALSPIEASFQAGQAPAPALTQAVFGQQSAAATAPPTVYVPVTALAAPGPAERKDGEARQPSVEDRLRVVEERAGMRAADAQPPAGGAGDATARFLGPFGNPLRQYGYAVFASYVSTFAPVHDVPVGPDYVVGPGDDLTISIWGPVENTVIRTVDRNGRILLPRVGDLRVWGLTFAQADRLIREQLGRYFRGFQTSVTMGRLRTVRVQVIGEVCQPGSYVLTSLATLTQALYAAGGPTKLGSLRSVRLLRNGHMVGDVDLYDFLLRGDRTRDYRLEAGDTIFVPTIGDVAAIAGEVKRPAIYEVRGDVRLADLVETAGGATPSSYLRRVQIVRAQPSAERVTLDVDLSDYLLKGDMASNPPVHAGDLVLIHRNDSRIYNTVKVEGAVKYPGVYELKPMMRLSQLVPADRLLPESYAERVEIARRRPDYSTEVLSVNLKKAWEGDREQDVLLRANDEITVRTEMRPSRTITLTGQVARPGTYVIAEGERLSSVLQRAGGFTSRAALKGAVFTRASLRKVEQEQLNAFVRVQEQRILAEASTTVLGGSDANEAAIGTHVVQARRDFLRALASRVAVGRMVIKLDAPEQLRGTPADIVLVDGDTLDVPEPVDSVLVLGSVRNSTSVLHTQNAEVDYYVNRVGGYTKEADKKEIHIVKADGSAVAGFSNIRTVDPGDTIIVPRNEDPKVRKMGILKEGFSLLGSALSGVLSIATFALLIL